jgi:hypothetical protein
MLFDGVTKVLAVPQVVEATAQLGFAPVWTTRIGILLLLLTCLYLIPRTQRLGALLLTGYLGGAIASQVRIGAPPFSLVFPILFAGLIWAGLMLRDRDLTLLSH